MNTPTPSAPETAKKDDILEDALTRSLPALDSMWTSSGTNPAPFPSFLSPPIVAPVQPPPPPEDWFYSDPQGNLQGPFSTENMRAWNDAGYFTPDLPVRLSTWERFYPLAIVFPNYLEAFWNCPSESQVRTTLQEERKRKEDLQRRDEAYAEQARQQQQMLAEKKRQELVLEQRRQAELEDMKRREFAIEQQRQAEFMQRQQAEIMHRQQREMIEEKKKADQLAMYDQERLRTQQALLEQKRHEQQRAALHDPRLIEQRRQLEQQEHNMQKYQEQKMFLEQQRRQQEILVEQKRQQEEILRRKQEHERAERVFMEQRMERELLGEQKRQLENAVAMAPWARREEAAKSKETLLDIQRREQAEAAEARQRELAQREYNARVSRPLDVGTHLINESNMQSGWSKPQAASKSLIEIQNEEEFQRQEQEKLQASTGASASIQLKSILGVQSKNLGTWSAPRPSGAVPLKDIMEQERKVLMSDNHPRAPAPGSWAAKASTGAPQSMPVNHSPRPAKGVSSQHSLPPRPAGGGDAEGESYWNFKSGGESDPASDRIVFIPGDGGIPPEFVEWWNLSTRRLSVPSNFELLQLCLSVQSTGEIREYFATYLGSTPAVSQFATEFIRRKEALGASSNSAVAANLKKKRSK